MYDPPAYVWALTIAGPTAIAATTGRIAGRDRIRDGPMHRGLAAQFLAGQTWTRHAQTART
jgi:hypothetical protein